MGSVGVQPTFAISEGLAGEELGGSDGCDPRTSWKCELVDKNVFETSSGIKAGLTLMDWVD